MLNSPRPSLSRQIRSSASAFILVALCLLVLTLSVSAQQLSIPGLQSPTEPKTNAKQDVPIQLRAARGEAPVISLYGNIKVDSSKLRRLPALSERAMQEKSTTLKRLRIGTVRAFQRPLDLSSDSALYRVAEGEVRVMGVVSEGALYTRVHFTGMSLPAGARVFVYSLKNPNEFYGPYEGRGLSKDGTFWTPPMEGDGVVIEYFTPSGKGELEDAPFQVSEISHTYRDPLDKVETETENAAGVCNLDVTADWSQVATSVGHLRFTSGGSEYACTGTLLNNQTNDHTPYLLTANHCFDTQAEAQTLRVYWNYSSGDVPPAGTPRTDGATLLATGAASDFTFVQLTGALPAGLFFSGWDATATPLSTSITGIHHPQGSYKRISFGATISGCGAGLPGSCQNYTNARWNSGTTEGGSSGSGIWKGIPADARLIGSLTGGAASCGNLSGTDYYGSFSVTYPSIASFLTNGSGPGPDDNLEENDSRAAAREMSTGTSNNLVVKSGDEDWYKVTVAAGATVTFTTNFTNASGDIDLSLYRNNDSSPVVVASTINNSETVQNQNSTGAPATYYLRVFLHSGTQNSYSLILQVTAPSCPVANPISIGQTLAGTLTASDCPSTQRSGSFSDRYTFTGGAAQQISITLTGDFNTYLYLLSPSGAVIASDDNGGGGTNSRIPAGSGNFTLPVGGTYAIEVTSSLAGATGSYNLNYSGPGAAFIGVTSNPAPEGGQAVITVTRHVDFSTVVTIDYATSDGSGLNPCNTRNGMASSRCDYATSVGTLRFAVGEQTKNLVIPIAEDVHVEGLELFTMTLTNATGIFLPPVSFPLQIIDNDVITGANPIDQTPFFVRQHYIDFLGREPDAAGWQGWQNVLNNCGGSVAPPCDRIEVSSAFFRSEEFQTRGNFVYRFYPTAFGRIPRYSEFMPDIAKVSGFLSPEQLEANKVAFINEFMARTEFKTLYDSTLNNPTAYVNALETKAGVTLLGKQVLIAELAAGRMTRAQVLRAIAESTEIQQKYYTESFVVMQYFGYLRRDPDILYLEWIRIMNQNNGDYRGMISGFMNSAEYRQRFGP